MASEDEDVEVFDDNSQANEHELMESKYKKMGFREGLEEGKEISLQNSFNYGFKQGFSISLSLNYLNNILGYVNEGKIEVSEQDKQSSKELKNKIEEYWLKINETKPGQEKKLLEEGKTLMGELAKKYEYFAKIKI